jgi:hypothetical protein
MPYLHHHCTKSTRPTGGFFISACFPKKTRAELTTELASSLTQKKIINQLAIVNKPVIINFKSTPYKTAILLSVEPSEIIVNKINAFSTKNSRLTTHD